MNSIPQVPLPKNEPVLGYAPGSPERALLKAGVKAMASEEIEIPLIIGGKEVRTGDTDVQVMPHDHGHVLARYHRAGEAEVRAAVAASLEAQREWAAWPWEDRLAVFLRAAELLATSWRPVMNGATMLGQSKTAHQAEIDAACEMIDFFRFNAAFAQKIYTEQPESLPGMWNRLDHRPLEGFVYAVTPFNFTSIAGNLPTAPAMMGNVAVWKPAATAVYSGWYIMRLLMEAGLPPGVINFLPGDPVVTSNVLLNDRNLAGIHFTGSTGVFQHIWKTVGDNIARYKSYPRLVGETGGKDFIVAHPSADPAALATAIVRGGFEYQGQKCSAASRVYIPQSLWPEVRDRVVAMMQEMRMGDVRDFRTFVGAVIDRKAFTKISGYIDDAKRNATVVAGGETHADQGYFIQPTLVETRDP
ncbi:MAG TPA: aldehyde dehydrogenase family protein, partial [Longimicrobium sp.]|nr:aldehyde dehydrogenase family protein [Longimicrobium sp.]